MTHSHFAVCSPPMTRDSNLMRRARAWLDQDTDPVTRRELEELMQQGDATELTERFAGRLEFGTAGIRGILGAGPMRMNHVVVREVTAGLADYLLDNVANARDAGVVVAFDGRRYSLEFAHDATAVLLGKGLRVYLATDTLPTPTTAFLVTDKAAAAGVMITASHNPPEYNGYKVYWSNGAQIIPPHDEGIAAAIARVERTDQLELGDLDEARASGRLVELTDADERRYLDGVRGLARAPELVRQHPLTIAYTPLHGVGGRFVAAAMRDAGVDAFHIEPGQADPDGEFPTVAFPNPEEEGAMDRVLALAERVNADLVLANDPDADRLAVAIASRDGGWRQLSGDEVGVLLADYLLRHEHERERLLRSGSDDAVDGRRDAGQATPATAAQGLSASPSPVVFPAASGSRRQALVATTIVSSSLLSRMASAAGAAYRETLTGFKWIANAALDERRNHDRHFVLGYEEALGYSVGELVRDKDGVSAAMLLAELTAWAKSRKQTLETWLEDLYRQFGLYLTEQQSITLPGSDGLEQIRSIMEQLRSEPPTAIGGFVVERYQDLNRPDSELPQSDVLIYRLQGRHRVIVRPSGTEPKLKSYYEVCEPVAADEPVAAAEQRARQTLQTLRSAHQATISSLL